MTLRNAIAIGVTILAICYMYFDYSRPYKLERNNMTFHTHEHHTTFLKARFFTKYDFDCVYKLESVERKQIEVEIDKIFAEKLINHCNKEAEAMFEILEHTYGSGKGRLKLQPSECPVVMRIKTILHSPSPEDLLKDEKIQEFLKRHGGFKITSD